MKVSVIIPTYNGANKLPNLLKALEKQEIKEFDVLVVIDGSNDNTVTILQELKHNLNLDVFVQENRGRASVRNTGAKKATGDLFIFFDDDMVPFSNCIREHLHHHQTHPASLMSGAQIDDPSKASTPFQKYKCYLSNKWAEPLRQTGDNPLPLEKMHLTAANFSIPKDIFFQLGGFDEELKDNEDLDLAIRAYQEGIGVYYSHSAFAWHDDFPSCKSFIKRQAEYEAYHNYVANHKKNIYSGVERFSEPNNSIPFSKKIFYWFWHAPLWVSLTDKGLLGFLPQKLQFNLYDWIVYANLRNKKSSVP